MGDIVGIKIGMIFLFFAVSMIGSLIPIFSPKWLTEGPMIPILCSLSAGTMLGVALAHLLPESNEILAEEIPDYSLAFALAGLGVIIVLAVEHIATAIISNWRKIHPPSSADLEPIGCVVNSDRHADHHQNNEDDAEQGVECTNPDHHHHEKHGHKHHDHGTGVLDELARASSFRDLIALYALELSVAAHSIILGVEFGLESDYKTLVALCIALSFHQTLEGIAMGAAVANIQAVLTTGKILTFMTVFASTISIGIIIGLISSTEGEAAGAEVVQGVFAAIASGALLYVALTEQVATYFNKPEYEDKLGVKLLMILAFVFGFGVMAMLATWE